MSRRRRRLGRRNQEDIGKGRRNRRKNRRDEKTKP